MERKLAFLTDGESVIVASGLEGGAGGRYDLER
jgi:hypothetical protein